MRLFSSFLPIDPKRVPAEAIAGLTLAAVGIPEVMGYSTIAHMPIVTGLYTLVLPIIAFAIFASSRHLVVGADSASAAILASGIGGLAAADSSGYIALAGMVALITGLMLIIVRLLNLSFVADFLSRTLLVGFLTGVGISVAVGELPTMGGVPKASGGTINIFVTFCKDLSKLNGASVLISVVTLALIFGLKYLNKKIPAGLIVVVGGIILGATANLESHGVKLIGSLKAGFPSLTFPHVPTNDFPTLFSVAASLVIVIVAQSAATSRAYAAKHDENLDEDADLVGLGFANVAAAVTGTYVVNGSPTKTEIKHSAGSRSQLASLVTAGATIIVLLFLTGVLQYLPNPVLGAVVFTIAVGLVDIAGMKDIYKRRRDEFVIAMITAIAVVVSGVEVGIILSILVCLVNHLRRSYAPKNVVMGIDAQGKWDPDSVESKTQAEPGVFIYRFQASLYYANIERLVDEVLSLTTPNKPKVICFDFSAVSDMDYTAGTNLETLVDRLKGMGIDAVFVHVADPVVAQLQTYGIFDLLGPDCVLERTHMVLDRYSAGSGSDQPSA